MKHAICSEEAYVLRAVRTAQWPEALRTHVAECRACQETAQLSRWMRGLALESQENPDLPDADLLWCKALLAQKQAEAERAQRPLQVAEVGAAAILALGLAGSLAWYWPNIQSWLWRLLIGWLPELWKAAGAVWSSAMTLSISAALPLVVIVFAVILAAYPILAEE